MEKIDCAYEAEGFCLKGLPGTRCELKGCVARIPNPVSGTNRDINALDPTDYWFLKYLKERYLKDKLTWQDIKAIVEIADSLLRVTERKDHFLINSRFLNDESYYKAVLEEYNKTRK